MEDSQSNNLNKNKEEEDKAKRVRRSKADIEGRSYECSLCKKSYLSYPALYTHKKLKHKEEAGEGDGAAANHNNNTKAHGGSESAAGIQNVSAETMDYFSTLDRKGQTSQQQLTEIFLAVFKEIFSEDWSTIYKIALDLDMPLYSDCEKYPLFLEIGKQRNQDSTHSNSSCNVRCDKVFYEYLSVISEAVNPQYFKKVVKFVFLYREYLNKYHRKSSKEGEYTSKMTAEDAPDISNEFLIEFIVIENSKMGYTKEEAINLTQNFCRWMFNESYTTSKLSIK